MRTLKNILTLVAGVLLALSLATAAYGAAEPFRNHPPGAWVRYHGESVQLTRLYYEDWYHQGRGGWVHEGPATYGYDWPQKDYVKPGTRVNLLIISYGAKPDALHMRRFGDVAKNGKPLGRGVRVPYHYYALRDKEGEVSYWGVYFKLPKGDHRIKLYMRWNQQKDYSYGAEVRLVHLKAR